MSKLDPRKQPLAKRIAIENPQGIAKLNRFRPKFKKGHAFAMLIFASRNSGKSYLVRHFIRDYLKRINDIFIIVSDSPDTKRDYEPCMPEGTIYLNEMNYEIINDINKRNAELEKKGKNALNTIILFDDKIGNNVKNDQNLLQIFTRGRHLYISLIFTSQSKKMADTAWTNNVDYVVVLKQNSAQQKESIIKNVLKGTVKTEDPKQEDAYLRRLVDEFASVQGDALVINNASQSSDNLFWYRAP
jgi:hypothetical protein